MMMCTRSFSCSENEEVQPSSAAAAFVNNDDSGAMAIDAATATVAEVKELVKANTAAAAERLKREGAYAVNVPAADAADADPIAQKYGECLLFGTIKKGVPKVTTAAFLPKPEFVAAVLMALG